MAEHALRLRGLTRQFGGVTAVRGVDLDVAHGERRAILGPNGAGKTTLFNLIAGDVEPTSGTVELFGQDVSRKPLAGRVGRGMSRTYQHFNLFSGLTVSQTMHLAIRGAEGNHYAVYRSRSTRLRHAATSAALLRRVDLSGRPDTIVAELSHGERRQLELAVALAANPKIVLLDEPAAGLSPAERRMLTDLLLSLDMDITLLFIEHDMDIALTVAQRITLMSDGEVVVEGTPAEIRSSETVQTLYLGEAADV